MELSAELQFKVSLRSMKIAPAVGPKGFARAVEFRVTSLDTAAQEQSMVGWWVKRPFGGARCLGTQARRLWQSRGNG